MSIATGRIAMAVLGAAIGYSVFMIGILRGQATRQAEARGIQLYLRDFLIVCVERISLFKACFQKKLRRFSPGHCLSECVWHQVPGSG